MRSSNHLKNAPLGLVFPPSTSFCPAPPPLLISKLLPQINDLHVSPCCRLCFGGTPRQHSRSRSATFPSLGLCETPPSLPRRRDEVGFHCDPDSQPCCSSPTLFPAGSAAAPVPVNPSWREVLIQTRKTWTRAKQCRRLVAMSGQLCNHSHFVTRGVIQIRRRPRVSRCLVSTLHALRNEAEGKWRNATYPR